MNRTYKEWAEKVTNTSADIALADMLADWQADIIQRTKAEHLLRVRANALELREAELEAEVEELIDLGNKLSYVVYETRHEKLAKKWTMFVSKK